MKASDLKITLRHLHNDQHFQYFMEFGNIITEFDAEELKIVSLFEEFKQCFLIEDGALKRIAKSALTAKIEEADRVRDDVFRGLAGTCKLATKRHFNEEAKEAAIDLMVVFDTYGDLTRKPLVDKTSAIFNLLQELREKHADDVKAAGLEEWMDEMAACNGWCYQMMQDRWIESSEVPAVSMKQARAGVDAAYEAIMERILALNVVEGGEIYEKFLRRLSAVVDAFNNLIAHRRHGSKDDGADSDNPAGEGSTE